MCSAFKRNGSFFVVNSEPTFYRKLFLKLPVHNEIIYCGRRKKKQAEIASGRIITGQINRFVNTKQLVPWGYLDIDPERAVDDRTNLEAWKDFGFFFTTVTSYITPSLIHTFTISLFHYFPHSLVYPFTI